jgi:hypothetical protein
MEGGSLIDILLVFHVRYIESLQAVEFDVLIDGGGHGAMGGVGISGDLEVVTGCVVDGAVDVSLRRGLKVLGDARHGRG